MTVAAPITAFFAGATLGAAHFGSLRWSVALIRGGQTGLGVAVQGLRFVALAAALFLVGRLGAGPLIAAAAGVLAARAWLMRRCRRLA